MALDKDKVRDIAFLARIRVLDAELDGLVGEINQIIGWVEQLGEVDTQGIEPMTGAVAVALPWRDDAVTDGGYAERVLANAPEPEGPFFTVPKVVDQ